MNEMDEAGMGGVLARLRAGDVRALARAISLVEDGGAGAVGLVAACRQGGRMALRVGVTGPPGAGKSTLVDALVREWRGRGKTVAVLAVDPSSPYSGGALLGDRIRMQGWAADAGVYIRSMATRGAMGGLAAAADDVCRVMQAAGWDVVVVETVGVGQDEVEVARLADVTAVVLAPGMGDEVQSLKAGMMEIADIFVVNKADGGGAERVEAEILGMQGLGGPMHAPRVVRTAAISGDGVAELLDEIERCAAERPEGRRALPQVEHGPARLDHVGVAVRSIAEARSIYEALGLTVGETETVEHEGVRVAMVAMAETRLELLEAVGESSVVGRFVAQRGGGLHHIAIRLGDVDAVFARLRGQGVRLVNERIQVGAGGHRYFFVHPASAGGVLLEVVGDEAAAAGVPA